VDEVTGAAEAEAGITVDIHPLMEVRPPSAISHRSSSHPIPKTFHHSEAHCHFRHGMLLLLIINNTKRRPNHLTIFVMAPQGSIRSAREVITGDMKGASVINHTSNRHHSRSPCPSILLMDDHHPVILICTIQMPNCTMVPLSNNEI